jgi:hypothetical protein
MCLYAKRLEERGKFAAPWKRTRRNAIEMTLSGLSLFEGREAIGNGAGSAASAEDGLASKFPTP